MGNASEKVIEPVTGKKEKKSRKKGFPSKKRRNYCPRRSTIGKHQKSTTSQTKVGNLSHLDIKGEVERSKRGQWRTGVSMRGEGGGKPINKKWAERGKDAIYHLKPLQRVLLSGSGFLKIG